MENTSWVYFSSEDKPLDYEVDTMIFEIEAEKRFLGGEGLVLMLEEIDQGPNKPPKLIPRVMPSSDVNWDYLIYKKYDDVVFEFTKENGEVIKLLIGSEITDDLMPLVQA